MRARAAFALVLAATQPVPAQDAPASAIPWLSDSLAVRPGPDRASEEPAATPLDPAPITTMAIGAPRRDAVGLAPASASGLPADLFAGSDPMRVAALMAQQPADALPAMQNLVHILLTSEFYPPRAAADSDALFFARIDTLLRLGALDQAQALLEQAGTEDAAAFRRWWDTSLLTGYDADACDAMATTPGIAASLPARIFCLTRTGDWAAAALTLDTGRALGSISDQDDALLAYFLDPELFEGQPPPVPPRPMTPLAFRLLDGIGETPSTRDLPLAFAVSDLRPTIGWKARIEAAERLARVGAITPGRLEALYTERRPAASGGVWDRATAIQELDVALRSGNRERIAATLPAAATRMREAGLAVPFATLYGTRLLRVELGAPADQLALRTALLSRDPAKAAALAPAERPRDAFALAIATGTDAPPTPGPLARAIADGMTGTPPDHLIHLAREDRLGEAILEAALLLAQGADSDPQDIADALAFLRAAGLEDVARRAALQLLLA